MAAFNPSVQVPYIPDENHYAQPIPVDRSKETLFSGIGQAVSQAGQTLARGVNSIYDMDKNDIYEMASNADTAINDKYGYGASGALINTAGANTFDNSVVGSGQKGSDPQQSPQLSNTQDVVNSAQTAMEQGKITPAMYWMQINNAAKEARARYPGMNQEIDQIFNEVTGPRTIQGHLKEAIEEQEKLAVRSNPDKALDSEFKSYLPEIENAMPGATIAYQNGTLGRDKMAQLVGDAARNKGQTQMVEAQTAKLKLLTEQGQANKGLATSNYSTGATQIVNTAISSLVNTTTPGATDGSSLLSSVVDANNQPDPAKVAQVNQLLTAAKLKVQQQLLSFDQNNTGTGLTAEEMEKQKKAALEPLDNLTNLINSKDYGIASRYGTTLKMGQDMDSVALRGANSNIREMSDLSHMGLGSTLNDYRYFGGSKVAAALVPGFSAGILGNTGKTIDSQTQSLQGGAAGDPHVTDTDKSIAVTGVLNQTADLVQGGKLPNSNVAEFAKLNFGQGPGQGGLQKTWSSLSDDGRQKLYNRLMSPAMQDAVLKTKDPEAISAYGQWMTDQFGTLKSVAGIGGDIKAANSEAGQPLQYQYNQATHQLVVTRPDTGSTQPGMFGMPGSEGKGNMAANQQNIQGFNTALANVAYFMKRQGVDPNGPQGIPLVLQNLGIPTQGLKAVGTNGPAFDLTTSNPAGSGKGPIGSDNKASEDLQRDLIQKNDDAGAQGPLRNAPPPSSSSGKSSQVQQQSLLNYTALRSAGASSGALGAISQGAGPAVDPKADEAAKAYLGSVSTHGLADVEGMQPVLRTRIADLFASAPPDIQKGLGIYSGYRDRATQASLFAHSDGSGRMVAPPGHSEHEKGLAADLAYNGQSLGKAPSKVVDWVHDHAATFGLKFPMSYENWHVEPVETRGGGILPPSFGGVDTSSDSGPNGIRSAIPQKITPGRESDNIDVRAPQTPQGQPWAGYIESRTAILQAIHSADPKTRAQLLADISKSLGGKTSVTPENLNKIFGEEGFFGPGGSALNQ